MRFGTTRNKQQDHPSLADDLNRSSGIQADPGLRGSGVNSPYEYRAAAKEHRMASRALQHQCEVADSYDQDNAQRNCGGHHRQGLPMPLPTNYVRNNIQRHSNEERRLDPALPQPYPPAGTPEPVGDSSVDWEFDYQLGQS